MLQMSKIVQSRDEWRNKANKRAEENREHRRTHKRHRETIAELKLKVKELQQKIDEDKKKPQTRRHRLLKLNRLKTRESSACY